MVQSTTKRYTVLKNNIATLKISDNDLYQFGCEFEFYIDTVKYSLEKAVEEIRDKIANFTDADILVDFVLLPTDSDKNHCVQIKPDQSLDDNGIEISIPITTKNGVKHYINNILPLIDYRQRLISEHKQLIESIDSGTKEEFSQALNEAGLIN